MADNLGALPARPRAGGRADVPRQRLGPAVRRGAVRRDLVMPDRFLQAEPLARAIEAERPTVAGCVPTIFADLLRYADAHDVGPLLADATRSAAARRCRGS